MKSHIQSSGGQAEKSPSLGREWIEIRCLLFDEIIVMSPSLGREWIEIQRVNIIHERINWSPSLGREWIEILDG